MDGELAGNDGEMAGTDGGVAGNGGGLPGNDEEVAAGKDRAVAGNNKVVAREADKGETPLKRSRQLLSEWMANPIGRRELLSLPRKRKLNAL
jgi:hypothetical protein